MFRRFVVSPALLAIAALSLPVAALAQSAPDGRFRAAGSVISVNEAESSFLMRTVRQGEINVLVTDETEYRSAGGQVGGLDELEPDLKLFVAGETVDGQHTAAIVAVPDPEGRFNLSKAAGLVRDVSPDAGTFSIETRGGDHLSFLTGDRTRYFSRDGSFEGLEDLKAGDAVRVVFARTDAGLVAAAIQKLDLHDRPDRPRLDFRAAGEIVGQGDASITLLTRAGERVTVVVTNQTKFRSRSGQVTEFGDLEVGMHALVAGVKTDGGELVALLVAVGDGDRPHDRIDRDRRLERHRERLKSDSDPAPSDDPSADHAPQ